MADRLSSLTKTKGQTVRWSADSSQSTGRRGRLHRTPAQRLLTPYRRTPGSRRLKLSTQRLRSSSPQEDAADLSELVGKTWRAYKATPLYAFVYEPSALRRYSRHLSAFIDAELKKGVGAALDELPDTASFSIFKGLKYGPSGREAVQVVLKARSRKDNVTMQPVLTALFMCIDMPDDISETLSPAFTCLPLVLVKGPVLLCNLLTGWVETQFDCSISPLIFPSMTLHWMVAMWAGYVPESKVKKPVELSYCPPPEVEGLSRISLTIKPQDCKRLWNSIHSSGELFVEKEVVAFIKALEAHFFQYFRVHLNAMQLNRIGTAIAYAASEGKIKIFSEGHILNILSHLTELAAEKVLMF